MGEEMLMDATCSIFIYLEYPDLAEYFWHFNLPLFS